MEDGKQRLEESGLIVIDGMQVAADVSPLVGSGNVESQTGSVSMQMLPKSQRPYERMYYQGGSSLSDQELIAIVLGSGSKDKNALLTASEILAKFGAKDGIPELMHVSAEELMTVKGIGLSKSVRILASLELGKRTLLQRAESLNCSSPKAIAERFLPLMGDLPHEELRALFLDRKNKLIRDLLVSRGGLSATVIDPRDVFREAIKANSSALILLHNHPSGDTTPSPEDLKSTRRFVEAGDLLGIKVHDHIIIGHDTYLSLYSNKNFQPLFIL